jgi:hypothetical protein
MPAFFPPPYTLFVIAFMAGLVFFAIRFAQPGWWKHWKIAALFFCVMLFGVAIWLCGYSWEGCAIAYTGILVFFPVALMLTTGWWGAYVRKAKSGGLARLYTTSGFGHWFHFRIGCPTELPILVLEGGAESEGASSSRA